MSDKFQIVKGREDKLFLDMGLTLSWESSEDRQTVTYVFMPTLVPVGSECTPRTVVVHLTGDVEIRPGIEFLNGSLELRQWASLLVWCLRNAYDKVYFIFSSVDQLRFK